MSLRVAVVGACPYPVPQGSQVYLRESAHALAHAGHEVHLVTYGHGVGAYADADPFPIHRAPRVPGFRRTAAGPSLLKPAADAALLRTLRRVVRSQGIDAVCAHNYEALAVALAAGKRPVLYFAHNLMREELPAYFPRLGASLWRGLGRGADAWLPRRADAVVAPHARLADALVARGCAVDAVHVVPPAIEAHAFTPCTAGETVPPVLYTGNLDRYQNLPLLFDTMRIVRETIPEARLVIASPMQAAFPDTTYVPTPDFAALRAVLAQDAVVAVPRVSWSGYPIKLLNAMAAGHACVACEGAAPPLRHEVNGLVARDDDAGEFAGLLLRCLRDTALRARLGTQARTDVEESHSRDAAATALDRILCATVFS